VFRALCALLVLAAAPARGADIVQPGEEKVTLMLGAFLPAFRSSMKVDNDRTAGDRFSLNDDLGVDDKTSGGWFGAEWRFAPRHRIGFTYSRFTLRGERDLNRTLQIGDEDFPVGAHLSSQMRLELVPITYSYSLLKRERDELAFTAGLHWSRLSFRVEGSASLASRDGSRDATASANLPLPLFGLRYDYNFTERWSAGGTIAVFALSYGEDVTNYKGGLISARLHGEYRFSRRFGVGAALDSFKVRVDADQEHWKGGLDYRYWGPQLYLVARF
jgi:hypothetical protein